MKLRDLTILSLTVLAPAAASADATYEAVEAAVAAPRNRALQRAAGDALKDAGKYKEAITFYLKSDNAGNLGAAEAAFYMYDFDKAATYLEKYLAKRTKAEIAKDTDFTYRPDGEPTDWTEYLSSRIDMGKSMLDRVEKIQVIDSINVPADKFFNYLRLARSAGRVVGEETVARIVDDATLDRLELTEISGPAYMTESGDDVIWTGADTDGNARMFESVRLADGTWDNPAPLFDYESIFGNDNGLWISAPFLQNDGVTLYFAADGEESLGGLDICPAQRRLSLCRGRGDRHRLVGHRPQRHPRHGDRLYVHPAGAAHQLSNRYPRPRVIRQGVVHRGDPRARLGPLAPAAAHRIA